MISRVFAFFIMALAAGWSVAGHAATDARSDPSSAAPAAVVVPNGVVPNGVVPNGVVPNGVVPNGVAPDGAFRVAQAIPPECLELYNNKPDEPKAQLDWFKELRECLENNRIDLIAPSLMIETPEEVDAGQDTYFVKGYVGDDGSVPTVTINGEAIELTAPGDGAPDLGENTFAFSLEVTVRAEDGDDKFLIEAVDAKGNSIAEERVVVLVAANRPKFKGDYYALIIGNGEYEFLPPLKTAVNDAKAVAEILRRYYLFDGENIQLLINATRRGILSALTKLKKTLGKHDRLLVFYSGHGYIDAATKVGFWQAADADEVDDFSWVSIDSVTRNIAGMQAKHVLVIADSAFPVSVTRGSHSAGKDKRFPTIDSYRSRKLIISGALEPLVTPISEDHSVFVYFLLEVLTENKDPYITSRNLLERLKRKIATVTDLLPEWGTVAGTGDEGSGEFTFIIRTKPLPPAE